MATWNDRKRKWVAKRQRDGRSYHLGYWDSKESAEEVEAIFDRRHPRNSTTNEARLRRKEQGFRY
jgi:hypothetical protein